MKLIVTDFTSCKGCLFFQDTPEKSCAALRAYGDPAGCKGPGVVTLEEPSFLCSNMRICDPALAAESVGGESYRLTAGDIVVLAESAA